MNDFEDCAGGGPGGAAAANADDVLIQLGVEAVLPLAGGMKEDSSSNRELPNTRSHLLNETSWDVLVLMTGGAA
jgi:hypothetical protein